MTQRIRCCTLFDVTHTGVTNRSKPPGSDTETWVKQRNTQCNFDTILQVISLRSQPDLVKSPIKKQVDDELLNKFGFVYQQPDVDIYCWIFEFEVHHVSVFDNHVGQFGALYNDCHGVPMIRDNENSIDITPFLDTSDELKNIHFEEL